MDQKIPAIRNHTNENAYFQGDKNKLSYTHHRNEKAVSDLSGEDVLFCGLYLSLLSAHCSPWWITVKHPICLSRQWLD